MTATLWNLSFLVDTLRGNFSGASSQFAEVSSKKSAEDIMRLSVCRRMLLIILHN